MLQEAKKGKQNISSYKLDTPREEKLEMELLFHFSFQVEILFLYVLVFASFPTVQNAEISPHKYTKNRYGIPYFQGCAHSGVSPTVVVRYMDFRSITFTVRYFC